MNKDLGIVSGVVVVDDVPAATALGGSNSPAEAGKLAARGRHGMNGERADGAIGNDAREGRDVQASREAREGCEGREGREGREGHQRLEEHGQPARVGPVRCRARRPCAVIVDADDEVRSRVSHALGASCRTHRAEPAAAVALLEAMPIVDVALVDCDQPVAVQAPIFRELARWPGALCVLMSADSQKVEQLRALGLFAPLVLDKPVQSEALDAIRSAALELFGPASELQ